LNHYANPDFWFCYRNLPEDLQQLADKAFGLLKENPRHPSLQFKKSRRALVGQSQSQLARASNGVPDGYVWFWVGNHTEYNKLLS
jgi:hypothetical protein